MYRAYGGAVRAFVHRRVPAAAADDVVADVFAIAWRRLADAPGEELSWLLAIARGVLANRRRGDVRRRRLGERLAANTVADVQPGPEGLSGESAVMCALRSLNKRDQELLLLIAWDELDRAQAARVLGISTGLLKVRLHRARQRLARALETHGATEHQAGKPPATEVLR
jgi:RNA polymerase sigma-70 factor (ECF subfamily)